MFFYPPDYTRPSRASDRAQIDELTARVAELERDAKRLDWLEQKRHGFYNLDRVSSIVGVGFLVARRQGVKYETLRAAIDAAKGES